MNYPQQTLPTNLRPLDPSEKLAGRVYTVSGHYDDSLDPHETLLQWTSLLSKVPSDRVVICQPHDSTLAHIGELSAETMKLRGVRGYIVDGGCRDSEFILNLGFKVFCRYFTPVDVVGRWIPDCLGESIKIEDVTIHTGDCVMADRDGVVIIPSEHAEEVTTKVEEVLGTESLVRKAIIGGMDPQKAYLKYGKF